MLVKVKSIANRGIQTFGVDVEVNISNRGIPGLEIVGLGDKSVAESRDRVKTAFQNSGLKFPNKKITIIKSSYRIRFRRAKSIITAVKFVPF